MIHLKNKLIVHLRIVLCDIPIVIRHRFELLPIGRVRICDRAADKCELVRQVEKIVLHICQALVGLPER